MSESVQKRVLVRFEKAAMAVVLRNVAGHNWGWFSREDPRMHLQTVDDQTRSGHDSAKVWLEKRGKRICQPAAGKVDLRKLSQEVQAERRNIETRWIAFMIRNGWLRAELDGHTVTLTAYPSSHNSFKRTIDLREEFPGAYNEGPRSYDREAPLLYLDPSTSALAVGIEQNPDDRDHIDLTKWVFVD